MGGRCQEHRVEYKPAKLAVFNAEQGRSQRAGRFPVIKYLKGCSKEKGADLFPEAPEESMTTKGPQIQGHRFQVGKKEENFSADFLYYQ